MDNNVQQKCAIPSHEDDQGGPSSLLFILGDTAAQWTLFYCRWIFASYVNIVLCFVVVDTEQTDMEKSNFLKLTRR